MSAKLFRGSGPLEFRVWDADVVAYDPANGDTHRLRAPAGAILERLPTDSDPEGIAVESIVALGYKSAEVEEAINILEALELLSRQ